MNKNIINEKNAILIGILILMQIVIPKNELTAYIQNTIQDNPPLPDAGILGGSIQLR